MTEEAFRRKNAGFPDTEAGAAPAEEPDCSLPKLALTDAAVLDDLQVTLTVEIGALKLSAGELLDLAAGQSFEFTLPDDPEVSLLLDGERIASGILVDDGRALAVEICSVHAPEL